MNGLCKTLPTDFKKYTDLFVDKDGNKVDPNSATALLNPYPVRNQLRSDQLHSEHPDSGKMYQEEMHPDQLLLPLDKDTKGSQKPIGHVEPVAIKS